MKLNYKKLDELIEVLDIKNKNNQYKELLGININKKFMKSVANIIGTDLSRYKVINDGYFACNLMHVGRDKKIPMALYKGNGAIVSPAYQVFKVKNNNEILSEYLELYFNKEEFDQKMYFLSQNGIRGNLDWKDFVNEIIEYPSLEEQKKIVDIAICIENNIKTNLEITNNLYKMCNKVYHNFIEKNAELLENIKIVDIAQKVITGKTPSTKNEEFWNGDIPFITIPDMHNQVFTLNTARNISRLGAKSILPKNSISVSCIATVGLVSISTEDSQTNQQINSIVLKNEYELYYLFEFLSEQEKYLKNIASGSTTYNINKNIFENIEVPYLPKDKLIEFNNIVSGIFEKIKLNQKQNNTLIKLKHTLLTKLLSGEIDLENINI